MTDSLLRRPDVEALTGFSRAWIYAAMSRGDFPRPIKIGIVRLTGPEQKKP